MKFSEKQKLCLKCMQCCKVMTIPTMYIWEPDNIELFRARGFGVRELKHPSQKVSFIELTIETTCPQLTENGCYIYNERPKTCREFDGRPYLGNHCLWSTLKEGT